MTVEGLKIRCVWPNYPRATPPRNICNRATRTLEPARQRLFAWLHHFRRLVIRWEYHVENFFGMVRLGYMQILLRYL
jgi:hypothetical protein